MKYNCNIYRSYEHNPSLTMAPSQLIHKAGYHHIIDKTVYDKKSVITQSRFEDHNGFSNKEHIEYLVIHIMDIISTYIINIYSDFRLDLG